MYTTLGSGDGAWTAGPLDRWTAEEGSHAIVLRDHLTLTHDLDSLAFEQSRMTLIEQGWERRPWIACAASST